MNKTQYEEMNDLLLVEKENKILEAKKLYKEQRKQHKDDKKEYKEKKRAYHEAKRKLKKECKEKRRYLKSEYRCIDYEKEVRIREKDMTEEQIRIAYTELKSGLGPTMYNQLCDRKASGNFQG